MILALIGLDEFAKDERIAKFWEGLPSSQRKVFFASEYLREGSLTAEIAKALAASFFEPAANVLVRHCELMLADEQKRLASLMGGGIQGNLVLDFSELDKRSSLYKLLDKSKAVEFFEPPKYTNDVQKWLESHVQKHFEKRINQQAALYIADAIGADTKRIHNEIKKIFLYDPNIQEINMQHCALFIKQDRDVPAYELQELFGFRNIKAFLPRFRRILAEEGDGAFMPVVGALRNHALTLLHIQAMRAKNLPDYEIAQKILPPNRTFTYQRNRLPAQSACWGQNALQKVILRLDELSYGKKTGFYEDLPSFELAICNLFL
ncbi:MAG: hypothetical protein LBC85_04485 [Fibromonadaceae bacterium]|jgi:DNA polymerase III delta subunit|nr:hypothetical protein [Fibromonadaceae bacterium]